MSMQGYRVETYGDQMAGVYDELYGERPMLAETVDLLAELAAGGPALELGIGTGRIALPLRARGIDVRGVDASPAMVEKMRAKPGGADVPVAMGDFADVTADSPVSLVYVVFNTFFGLLTQDDQVRCFANVATCLAPGGRFAMEAFVPDLGRFHRGQHVGAVEIDVDELQLEVSRHEAAEQRVDAAHLFITPTGTRMHPVRLRYAWPSELDLMGRLAGLALEWRWQDWTRAPFTSQSPSHVSVWRKPVGATT
jgi:SAM-dependent methyltransferase